MADNLNRKSLLYPIYFYLMSKSILIFQFGKESTIEGCMGRLSFGLREYSSG